MQYMGSAHMHSAAQCSAHMQSAVRAHAEQSAVRAHAEHSAMQGAMQAGRAQRNAGRNTEHTHRAHTPRYCLLLSLPIIS